VPEHFDIYLFSGSLLIDDIFDGSLLIDYIAKL